MDAIVTKAVDGVMAHYASSVTSNSGWSVAAIYDSISGRPDAQSAGTSGWYYGQTSARYIMQVQRRALSQ